MKRIIAIGILIISVAIVSAQTSVTASVNKSTVGLNDHFQLTITISNAGKIKGFQPPNMKDFIVLGGPNQTQNVNMSGGQITQYITYSYVLQARDIGKYSIGAAYVKTEDKTYSTSPINIEVIDKPAPQNNTQNNNQGNSGNSGAVTIDDYLSANVFIKTIPDKSEVYKGESFSVTYKLYVARGIDIANYMESERPKFDGFYERSVSITDPKLTSETVNGKNYQVLMFKQSYLTPQKTGTLTLDPLTLDGIYVVRVQRQRSNSNDPFQDLMDQFFNDPFSSGLQQVKYTSRSSPVKINVKELPANAPADFNGAVGSFTMKTELNATQTKTDEPLTYRIIISGTGNLELFNPPQLNLPPGWEAYDPKTTESGSTKTFEYLLIPRSPGDFIIPSYAWSYLDPSKNKFVSLSSESYQVKVEAGPGYNPAAGNYAVNKEDVEMLAQDIRYIKKDPPHYSNADHHFYGGGLFYSLLFIPLLAGGGIFVMTAKKKKLESDTVLLKNKKANTVAKKRLTKAAALVQDPNAKLFYDEIIKTVWGYLSDKLNIPQSELSKENIREYLLKHQVTPMRADETIQLLDTCEMALFAPQLAGGSPQSVYQKTMELITQLENEIK